KAVGLFDGGWWHSASIDRPFWQATFQVPMEVDELRVINRPDGKGLGNRDMQASVRTADGHWSRLRSGRMDDVPRIARALDDALGGELQTWPVGDGLGMLQWLWQALSA